MQTPALLPFPDLTQPELAYPMYPHPEIDPELIARIDDVYLRNLDMPELIEKARIAVISHAGKLLREDPSRNIDYIVLDMPCTFFMLRSLRYLSMPYLEHFSMLWQHHTGASQSCLSLAMVNTAANCISWTKTLIFTLPAGIRDATCRCRSSPVSHQILRATAS